MLLWFKKKEKGSESIYLKYISFRNNTVIEVYKLEVLKLEKLGTRQRMENGNWLQIFKIDFVSKKRNRVSIYAKCFFFFDIVCVCRVSN